MSETPIYKSVAEGTPSAAGTAPEPPAPVNATPTLAADVEAVIKARLDEVEAKYEAKIKALQDQLDARAPATGLFAAHAAGPGLEIRPTWSQAEQEAARLAADAALAAIHLAA